MAYYETDVGGTLDANGALTLRLGPLSERGLHFLGYFVGQIDGGSNSATYQVQTKNGFPLAYGAGDLVVIGPIWIPANDYKVLQISGGTPGGSLKGQITGDSNRKFDDLLIRPTPTSGNPAAQTVIYTGKDITAGTEAGSVVAATPAGVALNLTANTKSVSYLTNPGPLRIQLSSSGASGVDVIFATLYTDDIAVVAEPMLLTVLAPDGNQNLNVLTLQHA